MERELWCKCKVIVALPAIEPCLPVLATSLQGRRTDMCACKPFSWEVTYLQDRHSGEVRAIGVEDGVLWVTLY